MKKAKDKVVFAGKTIAQLEAMAAEFDRPFSTDSFGPLTPKDQALWERVKRKRGRPRVGKGAKVISVSIEGGLLERIDRAARRLKTSRAGFMATAARSALAKVEPASPRKPRRK